MTHIANYDGYLILIEYGSVQAIYAVGASCVWPKLADKPANYKQGSRMYPRFGSVEWART